MTRSRRTRRRPLEMLERRYRRLFAWYPAAYRAAPQWAVLGAVPVLGFAAATVWLHRHERMLRLVAAGSSQ